MAEQHEPPGSLGIEALGRKVEQLAIAVKTLGQHLGTGLTCLERAVNQMATFDQLKQLVADQKGLIQQEAGEVKAKLDENAALIQQLRDQLNNPPDVQEIFDQLSSNNSDLQNIFSAAPAARK